MDERETAKRGRQEDAGPLPGAATAEGQRRQRQLGHVDHAANHAHPGRVGPRVRKWTPEARDPIENAAQEIDRTRPDRLPGQAVTKAIVLRLGQRARPQRIFLKFRLPSR